MAITDWPQRERPREKLIHHGATCLSDAELLAIFLRTGVAGKTAVDLARDLITQFGNLRTLLSTQPKQLCQHYGMGQAKYAQLQAALEMGRRYLYETLQRGNAITNPSDAYQYLTAQLRDYQHEVFACLFLDIRHRVIVYEELFHGTINSSHIHPREIIKRVLYHNAAAVIFAHNHPSGITEPSQADIQMTQQLKNLLTVIDVRVLDHVIIGEGSVFSFANRGLL